MKCLVKTKNVVANITFHMVYKIIEYSRVKSAKAYSKYHNFQKFFIPQLLNIIRIINKRPMYKYTKFVVNDNLH